MRETLFFGEVQTEISEGPHILTVADVAKLTDRAGKGAIYAILQDEDGEELIKVFLLPEYGLADDFLDFALACGLDEGEALSGDRAILCGRRVEAAVYQAEDGQLGATNWVRVTGDTS